VHADGDPVLLVIADRSMVDLMEGVILAWSARERTMASSLVTNADLVVTSVVVRLAAPWYPDMSIVSTNLFLNLKYFPCFVFRCLGSPFTCYNVKMTHCCNNVVCDAYDGGSCGGISACHFKLYSIVDLCEEDCNGGWRVQLIFHAF
jgi:hypothetical protein